MRVHRLAFTLDQTVQARFSGRDNKSRIKCSSWRRGRVELGLKHGIEVALAA